jgi:hypothetical protein
MGQAELRHNGVLGSPYPASRIAPVLYHRGYLSGPTFGCFRARTLPRLTDTRVEEEKEEPPWAGTEIGKLEAEGKAAAGEASDTSASEAVALGTALAIRVILARRCRSTSLGTGLGNTWRA